MNTREVQDSTPDTLLYKPLLHRIRSLDCDRDLNLEHFERLSAGFRARSFSSRRQGFSQHRDKCSVPEQVCGELWGQEGMHAL